MGSGGRIYTRRTVKVTPAVAGGVDGRVWAVGLSASSVRVADTEFRFVRG